MLYVFIVSTGTTMKFDMNMAVKKVSELKLEVYKRVLIPVEDQVLLCSGGEELKSENIVGNYFGAGTDTNPIFLFSKSDVKLPFHDNATSIDLGIVNDVKACAEMDPSIQTITVRAALAQDLAELALKGKKECNELVHQQHLQQQGWAAVIANLEDAKDSLMKRKQHFDELFEKYLSNRASYQEIIKIFPDDIALLAKVPLLSKLLIESGCSKEDLHTEHTLLSWFCSEPQQVLETLAEKCQRSLDELNENALLTLNEEFNQVLRSADNPDIKEVRGIEERLSSLNKQIEGAEKLSKDQSDLTGIFSPDRINYARDPNVLPDVCRTYQNQLELMLQNHMCLGEILKKCKNAKSELSESINVRIKYICRLESEMYDLQVRIIFLEKHVKSVMNQIESFHQVHLAPQRYLKMLAEVCRRKEFSSNFIKWAKELSEKASTLYQKELILRKEFNSEEFKNMVDNLFPGMDDTPPPFAVECPQPFDQQLPNIAKEDLDFLKILFPELSHLCEVLPSEPMPYISQAGTDSAFSSNLPSSLKIVSHIFEATDISEKSLSEKGISSSPSKVVPPSSDFNSLPSEYASLPNEYLSLSSSPFEDPYLNSSGTENKAELPAKAVETPILKGTIKEEKQSLSVESDGEEFERVDPYGSSPMEIAIQSFCGTRRSSHPRTTSSSDITSGIGHRYPHRLKVTRARSDSDAVSPLQDRLRTSDSLLADFQSADYFIDDSMPSSYTESNATSPLLHGSRMVKSHHVVVAELQRQLEEKNDALTCTSTALDTSPSKILKVHAKISELQKFIRELQGMLQSDLTSLKEYVKDELSERMSDASQVVEKINVYVEKLHQQMTLEKEHSIAEAKKNFSSIESAYINRLEVESQKLKDAESQIASYQERLCEVSTCYDAMKQEKEQVFKELEATKETVKQMILEHELEFDSFKNQIKNSLEDKDCLLDKLKQNISEVNNEVQNLQSEKEELQKNLAVTLKEISIEKATISEMVEERTDLHRKLLHLEDSKSTSQDHLEGELLCCYADLEESKKRIDEYRKGSEIEKQNALKELEEKLNQKHRNDIESLRSRFRLAVSTTSIDRVTSSSPEPHDPGSPSGLEDLKKIIAENREKMEIDKDKAVRDEHNKMMEKLNSEILRIETEKEKIIAALQVEHEETLERTKSRITAESQVSFNEAINRLAKEKDATIEDLKSELSLLRIKQAAIKAQIDKYNSLRSKNVERVETMSQSESCHTCANELQKTEEDVFLMKLKDLIVLEGEVPRDQSIYQSTQSSLVLQESAKKKHKTKEEHQRLPMGYLWKYSCLDCKNKISILTCSEGDLVLLCFEERHQNFAIFHIGEYAHFLHTDSLQALNLKLPGDEPEKTISTKWALGVVIHKEFCVTKKKENRYKVELGTKFYRVKVKPWDRETAFTLHQMQQSTLMTTTICAPKSTSFPSTSEDGKGGTSSDMSASSI